MNVLEDKNPDLYQRFKVGNFVVWRNARPWAGLFADLVIEQELMSTLKTTGGLTRGSGMSEVQRAVWLLSMPICSMYKEKMEEIVNKTYVTSSKEVFLANKANKERFIHILGDTSSAPGYGIIYCEGDADVDIAKTAIGMSEQSDVMVIGEDTDLLILLLHYYNTSLNKIYFRSDRSSKSNTIKLLLGKIYVSAFYLYMLSRVVTTSQPVLRKRQRYLFFEIGQEQSITAIGKAFLCT